MTTKTEAYTALNTLMMRARQSEYLTEDVNALGNTIRTALSVPTGGAGEHSGSLGGEVSQ